MRFWHYWLNWPYWPEVMIVVGWAHLVTTVDSIWQVDVAHAALYVVALWFLWSRSISNKARMRRPA